MICPHPSLWPCFTHSFSGSLSFRHTGLLSVLTWFSLVPDSESLHLPFSLLIDLSPHYPVVGSFVLFVSGSNVTSSKSPFLTTLSSLPPHYFTFVYFRHGLCHPLKVILSACCFIGLSSHVKNVSRLLFVLVTSQSLHLEKCLIHSRCS